MDKFAALKAFTAVIETGSFQSAAERLGITKSVISRRVSQFEQSLQCRLLHRTTRRLSLTDEGRQFYQRAVQILSDLEDAELETTHKSMDVRGRLKLAAPLSFGLLHLSETINQFLIQHPAIELELDLNDRNINLVEDGFDMAVRIGLLEDSTLVAKRIGSSRSIT
ncbi:MAG: LysR family transcriptional regulator, partial [Gammaproteobacteria bacterium]|nr:LysR family transcriptional regulator [Gammaproteobacteria bacterium]